MVKGKGKGKGEGEGEGKGKGLRFECDSEILWNEEWFEAMRMKERPGGVHFRFGVDGSLTFVPTSELATRVHAL